MSIHQQLSAVTELSLQRNRFAHTAREHVNVNMDVYSLISPLSSADFIIGIGTLLYSLIPSGENSAHFLQLMPLTILQFSFHQVGKGSME